MTKTIKPIEDIGRYFRKNLVDKIIGRQLAHVKSDENFLVHLRTCVFIDIMYKSIKDIFTEANTIENYNDLEHGYSLIIYNSNDKNLESRTDSIRPNISLKFYSNNRVNMKVTLSDSINPEILQEYNVPYRKDYEPAIENITEYLQNGPGSWILKKGENIKI